MTWRMKYSICFGVLKKDKLYAIRRHDGSLCTQKQPNMHLHVSGIVLATRLQTTASTVTVSASTCCCHCLGDSLTYHGFDQHQRLRVCGKWHVLIAHVMLIVQRFMLHA